MENVFFIGEGKVIMKTLHIHKVMAIAEVKFRALCGKNCIIMPIFAIGFTMMMRFLYQNMSGDGGSEEYLNAYALAMGLVMNIGMTGLYCISLMLAEEKEKKTLRVLMTSSVNALEFFVGSVLPVFLVTVIVNYLLMPISGYTITGSNLILFSIVTMIGTLISCIIGMLLGIFAKNQVSTSTLTSPILLLMMLVPMLSSYIEELKMISPFIFTGAIMDMVMHMAEQVSPALNIGGILAMIIEAVVSIALFVLIYKRNGYEKE